jgi:16S rRNA (cytidine1402-2'-O)-methyltransferase
MSTFFVVGTPIGNMEDITLRAIKVLSSVDLILCEDTRVTKKLLSRHNISTPTYAYHAHSSEKVVEKILSDIEEGKSIALVTDAGTPGISDPGAVLVKAVRDRFKSGEVKIEAIPGPSALTTALSISGIPAQNFTFYGFLPHKKGRQTIFKEILSKTLDGQVSVFYESPHRLEKTLNSLMDDGGVDDKILVTVVRELTKIYEEVFSGSPSVVMEYFKNNQEKVRGEFVIIVSGK